MKGWRTLIFNGGLAVLIALLHFVVGTDWTQYVSPQTGMFIVLGANAILRAMTDTSVGSSK
jgi:hypothetical protein